MNPSSISELTKRPSSRSALCYQLIGEALRRELDELLARASTLEVIVENASLSEGCAVDATPRRKPMVL